MNWGKSIVLAFVLFAAFVATLVTICVREDIPLVTKDYYREELMYQQQINRLVHTANLEVKPAIEIEQGFLKVTYADFPRVENGTLTLFRPSDESQDRRFSIDNTDKSVRYFSTEGMQKGMYRAKMRWTINGEEYYIEQIVEV
jgi:hypothetical protein